VEISLALGGGCLRLLRSTTSHKQIQHPGGEGSVGALSQTGGLLPTIVSPLEHIRRVMEMSIWVGETLHSPAISDQEVLEVVISGPLMEGGRGINVLDSSVGSWNSVLTD